MQSDKESDQKDESGAQGTSTPPLSSTSSSPTLSSPSSSSLPNPSQSALQRSLDQLVDTAAGLVEQGKVNEAVEVLERGIDIVASTFPNSPELSELHNQAALLLFFQGRPDVAAPHATASLHITKEVFGAKNLLTAHRQLRLGTILFGQGQVAEAASMLREAGEIISTSTPAAGDAVGAAEAGFYLGLVDLARSDEVAQVRALEEDLLENLKKLKENVGPRNMMITLALGQHSKLVNLAIDRSHFPLGEALVQQHLKLLTEVYGETSPEVALVKYQLGTYYYANDLLQDAGTSIKQAAQAFTHHFPDDHDFMVMCKHRLGMICAASHDFQAASSLLTDTQTHYQKQDQAHPLAHEGAFGLALCKLWSAKLNLSGSALSQHQQQCLQDMKGHLEAMAKAIGSDHMLVQGAARYHAQASVFAHR